MLCNIRMEALFTTWQTFQILDSKLPILRLVVACSENEFERGE